MCGMNTESSEFQTGMLWLQNMLEERETGGKETT